MEEQPIKEEEYEPILSNLKDQIEASNDVIQKIDELEEKFTKKNPYGKFSNLQERQSEFVNFLEDYDKLHKII